MEEQREEDILRVEDAMQPADGPVLDAEKTLDQAVEALDHSEIEQVLVRLTPMGWGSVSRQQLLTMASEGKGATALGASLPIAPVPYLHPDHPLETALRYVDRWPLVPVVSRADFGKLEGVVTQRYVLERYREFGQE
jgi:hypothetical protein